MTQRYPLPFHQRNLLCRQAVERVHELVYFGFQSCGIGDYDFLITHFIGPYINKGTYHFG